MKLSLLIAFLAFALAAHAEPRSVSSSARAINGDTLEIRSHKVRMAGIDAPERRQTCKDRNGEAWPCGTGSTLALRARIAGRKVRCGVHIPRPLPPHHRNQLRGRREPVSLDGEKWMGAGLSPVLPPLRRRRRPSQGGQGRCLGWQLHPTLDVAQAEAIVSFAGADGNCYSAPRILPAPVRMAGPVAHPRPGYPGTSRAVPPLRNFLRAARQRDDPLDRAFPRQDRAGGRMLPIWQRCALRCR